MSHNVTLPNPKRAEIAVQIMHCNDLQNGLLDKIKSFVSRIYSEAGYSTSEWKNHNFDPWSTWFWVEGQNGRIIAAMRLTEKRPNNFIPTEIGIIFGINPKLRYAIAESNVADWGAVAFELNRSGLMAAKETFRTVARICLIRGYERVYGFYNPALKGIEKLYLSSGVELSQRYSAPIYFPEFCLDGKESLFNVIECDKYCLHKIASKL